MRKLKLIAAICAIFCTAVSPASASVTKEQALKVWSEVGQSTGLSSLPFSFKESIVPNAWVTSGKSVTVTTGLLEMLETEDELYGVLAHEAGHVKLRHADKTVSRQIGTSILTSVISSLIGGVVSPVANVGVSLASAGYSRQQEIESDDYAVKLAFKNGKNMAGLYTALQKLAKHNKTEPSGFNSHPPDERRLLHVRNMILSLDKSAVIPGEENKEEKERISQAARYSAAANAVQQELNRQAKYGANTENNAGQPAVSSTAEPLPHNGVDLPAENGVQQNAQ
ncbi:MAG: M48 family metallopeptidase [Synergistaceae bacterium]|nr:M48 family metallopeptidase [Synergistaceae bacterium]